MVRGLLGGDQLHPDHLGRARVIGRELRAMAAAHQVGATVADVRDDRFARAQRQRSQRRAHPATAVLHRRVEHRRIRVPDGRSQALMRLASGSLRPALEDRLDGDPAGHLAGRVPAEPVGEHEERAVLPRVVRRAGGVSAGEVFVRRSLRAGIGAIRVGQLHEDGVRRETAVAGLLGIEPFAVHAL